MLRIGTCSWKYDSWRGLVYSDRPHLNYLEAFLKSIRPLEAHLGPLIFQFEYLNKQKMDDQAEFQERFQTFIVQCPREYRYAMVDMIHSLITSHADVWLNVNNHFEGSAPLSIQRIKNRYNNDKKYKTGDDS